MPQQHLDMYGNDQAGDAGMMINDDFTPSKQPPKIVRNKKTLELPPDSLLRLKRNLNPEFEKCVEAL